MSKVNFYLKLYFIKIDLKTAKCALGGQYRKYPPDPLLSHCTPVNENVKIEMPK